MKILCFFVLLFSFVAGCIPTSEIRKIKEDIRSKTKRFVLVTTKHQERINSLALSISGIERRLNNADQKVYRALRAYLIEHSQKIAIVKSEADKIKIQIQRKFNKELEFFHKNLSKATLDLFQLQSQIQKKKIELENKIQIELHELKKSHERIQKLKVQIQQMASDLNTKLIKMEQRIKTCCRR